MNKMAHYWLAAAGTVCLLVVGIPYWSIPYHQIALPYDLMGPGLAVVVIAAGVLRAHNISTFIHVVGVVGASVPAAVLVRVAWDVLQDPTTHNLWPIEIFLSLPVGFACALTGAFAGYLISMLKDRYIKIEPNT